MATRERPNSQHARKALKVLKTAPERAWKLELIPTNPAKLVDPPKVKRARREEITVDHVRRLLAATASAWAP